MSKNRKRNKQTRPNPQSNRTWLRQQENMSPILPYIIQYQRYVNHYYEWLQQIGGQLYEWEGFPDEVPSHMIEPMVWNYGTVAWQDNQKLGEIFTKGTTQLIGSYNVPTFFQSTDRFFTSISFPIYYYGRYKFPNSGLLLNNRLVVPGENQDLSSTRGMLLYAEQLATLKQISDINLNAQKTPIVMLYDGDNLQSIQHLYDEYDGSKPVIFSRKVIDEKGELKTGEQMADLIKTLDTKAPFILDKIEAQKEKVWNEAMSWYGLSSVAHVKTERLTQSESESTQDQFLGMQNSMLQSRLEFCKLYKMLTGRTITCRPTSQTFKDERGKNMPSLPRWSSRILDWLEDMELSDDEYELLEKLSTKDILLYKFEKFMSDVEWEFTVFSDKENNQALKRQFIKLFLFKYIDLPVGIETEYMWRMKFEKVILSHLDRYNQKLRIQYVMLVENESKIFENYNMKINFDEETKTNIKSDKNQNKDISDNQKIAEKGVKTVESKEDKDKSSTNFNRNIYKETPDGILNLTTNEGEGVITVATTITEDLGKDAEKNINKLDSKDINNKDIDNTTKTTEKTVDNLVNDTKQSKLNERLLVGYQNLASRGRLISDYKNNYEDELLNFCNLFDGLFSYI